MVTWLGSKCHAFPLLGKSSMLGIKLGTVRVADPNIYYEVLSGWWDDDEEEDKPHLFIESVLNLKNYANHFALATQSWQ